MNNAQANPIVFISYSWASEERKKWVLSLAEKLMTSGIQVILDQWDLKHGQDRYLFMEQSIANANKVLVICDKAYCNKANARSGGVGTETTVMSPELYGNSHSEKFIPIAVELDENNDYLLPTYMKNRYALGMLDQDEFESKYQELIRIIWEEPLLIPPKLGTKPIFTTTGDISKPKLLYLYANIREDGEDHIQSRRFVKELMNYYEVELAYGIYEDKVLYEWEESSLKKQYISENDFMPNDYKVVVIENTLGEPIEGDLATSRFRLSTIDRFTKSGGVCIYLMNEQIYQKGVHNYNNLLEKMGLPLIRQVNSVSEFPMLHLVDEDKLDEIGLYAWDEKNQIDYPRTYFVNIDDEYLSKLDPVLFAIFENVNRIAVRMSLQVNITQGTAFLTGNKETQILSTGDLFWDGDIRHYFGSYRENGRGFGILLGSNICSDYLVSLYPSTDVFVLMENLLDYISNVIEERRMFKDLYVK